MSSSSSSQDREDEPLVGIGRDQRAAYEKSFMMNIVRLCLGNDERMDSGHGALGIKGMLAYHILYW